MPKYWDYVGFRFNGVHSSDLGILRVSDGSRYEEASVPEFKSETAEVVGGHGTYFWGSYHTKRTFTLNLAYDSITEEQVRAIRQTYQPQALGELIFDEWPYKAYNATIEEPPVFKFIPFKRDEYVKAFDTEPSEVDYSQNYYKLENGKYKYQLVAYKQDWNNLYIFKSQWYKGEGTIKFVCYEPFAHGLYKWREDCFDFTKVNNPTEENMSSYYMRWGESGASGFGGPFYYKCRRTEKFDSSTNYYTRGLLKEKEDNPDDETKRRLANYSEWVDTIPLGYRQYFTEGNPQQNPHTNIPWCVRSEHFNDETQTGIGWRTLVYNPGDVATNLKIIYYVNELDRYANDPVWGTIALIEVDNGSNDFVPYKNCTLTLDQFTPYSGDSFIIVDMKSHTIYGATGSNGVYQPTGTLYNKYITAGDFFQIPVYPNFHIKDDNSDPHLLLYSKIKYKTIDYNFLFY